MPYKSDDLWAAGTPEPPYFQTLVEYLVENSHTYFNPTELAEVIFDLKPAEEAWDNVESDFDIQAMLNSRLRRALHIEIMLEDLVVNGAVEKRSIRTSDQIDAMRAENPEVARRVDVEMERKYGDELPDEHPGRSDFWRGERNLVSLGWRSRRLR